MPHLALSLFKGKTLQPAVKREFFSCRSKDAGPCQRTGARNLYPTRELRSSAMMDGSKGHDLRH